MTGLRQVFCGWNYGYIVSRGTDMDDGMSRHASRPAARNREHAFFSDHQVAVLVAGACVEVRRHAVQRCLSGSGGRYRGRHPGRQGQNIASSRRRMRGGSSARGASR